MQKEQENGYLTCIVLSHFHAARHLAHAKSAHLYLQQMCELPEKMPEREWKQHPEKRIIHCK